MTYLTPQDCNEEYLTSMGVRVHRGVPFVGNPDPQPYIEVQVRTVRHQVTLLALKVVVKLLALMDWGVDVNPYNAPLVSRRHILLNEAAVVNRHDIALRYRRSRKEFKQSSDLWDSVKKIRALPMDTRMMKGLVKFAESWPEVMWCIYDGEFVVDFDGRHEAGPGQIRIRFWPVLFTDADHYNTRGLSAVPVFTIDEFGGVWHNYNDEDMQPHPHCFTDGGICNGEANFGTSQMLSLNELHNWWVGTDHSPADGDNWSYQCYQWWQDNGATFFEHYHGAGAGTAYYVEAPQTSMQGLSTESDREAEAVTRVLTPQGLDELLLKYNSTEGPADYDYECYVCGTGMNDEDAYFCSLCEEPFCRDHYNRDRNCCEECFNKYYQRCIACRAWTHEDDQYCCDNCGETVCRDCVVIKDDPYCPNCATDEEEEPTGDITPHDYVAQGTPKPGWVHDPEILGGLTCHHEAHGPFTTGPNRPTAAWRFEDGIPPLEDLLVLRSRYVASHNAGWYTCDEHVPRVPVAEEPQAPFVLTKSMYQPCSADELRWHLVCEFPSHRTYHENGCRAPAEYRLGGNWFTNPEGKPEYLCAACYNDIEMQTVGFWPVNENNLGGRGARRPDIRTAMAFVGGNPGATAVIRTLNQQYSEQFREAVIEAEYACEDALSPHQEDYEPEDSLRYYNCEYPMEMGFGYRECHADASWRAIDLSDDSPAAATGFWLCTLHYEALPSRRAAVAQEVLDSQLTDDEIIDKYMPENERAPAQEV